MSRNPAKLDGRNPQPSPRPVRPFTFAEVELIAGELSEPLPGFVAATGLRPEEWGGPRTPRHSPSRRDRKRSSHRLRW
jgi:hypothetical protein